MTGSSTLDPDNFPSAPDRVLGRGHGTRALGPSDSSDSGSDVQHGNANRGGPDGPDFGDTDLNSDTDAEGTGERASAGRDTVAPDGADINVDHIETLPELELDDSDEDEPEGTSANR
jgi:hypothetical protein